MIKVQPKNEDINTTVFDFEACGIKKKSVILTLSGVRFNRFSSAGFMEAGNEFNAVLPIPEQLLKKRIVDPGTMKWWSEQSDNAKLAAFSQPVSGPVKEILDKFFSFISGTQLFCRGTDFDPPKLVSLCKDFNVKVPLKYNEYRDVRTYIDAFSGGTSGYLKNEDFVCPGELVRHISLHDCWIDASQMIQARELYHNREDRL